ncbi:hypothetical protein A1OO_04810 [Enterovibrio norvegicus FF-33]|uniref:DUF2989 domain-containing protein n=1 Tax=Enterovibrio norvegicus TaxID=188144 RepID=UPI0002EB3894|nr:DUF2989 domain-containing protein [Enterovibrio norvegicus]OEE70100.1 hypothetical protein A1OO_04810 [Enterovibrio norvegicus FF-33]OEE86591.1 hypothetical protein A1OQ_16545 [Enterovibrio norvegicus FF-162]
MNKGPISFPYKVVITAISTLLLAGCFESNRSTAQLCENYPQICNKLNTEDGQCRHERTDLIWLRFDVIKKPSDLNKFDELQLTKKYAKCMSLAAQIESTTLKSKKTLRTEALFHAYDTIDQLELELKSSYQPSIIYYRWTQGDQEALEQFLKLEETEYLDSPEMQLGLASYYVDKDKVHTINLLMKSLTLYDGRSSMTMEKTIPDVVKSLATANHSLGKLDEAYMWALVGSELGLAIAKEAQIKLLYPMIDERRALIADISDDIASSIESGNFDKSMLIQLSGLPPLSTTQ